MPPALLRTLPFGTGVLLLRQTRPAVIDLQPWTARRDADALRAAQSRVEPRPRPAPRRRCSHDQQCPATGASKPRSAETR